MSEQPVSLKFVIVGASLAGLATAHALRLSGHEVVVLEQKSEGQHINQGTGRVSSTPNSTRILQRWGLPLEEVGVKCDALTFQSAGTGKLLRSMELGDKYLKELAADLYFFSYADLHSLLYNLAIKEGAIVRFNSGVASVDAESSSVRLESGEVVKGDIIVGADGHNSLVRPAAQSEGEQDTPAIPLPMAIFTMNLPAERLKGDPLLESFSGDSDVKFWADDNLFALGCSIHAHQSYTLTISIPVSDAERFNENWEGRFPSKEFLTRFTHVDARVQKIIEKSEYVTVTAAAIREPFDNAICDDAVLCLVGEAAHPMLPYGLHNPSLAIEDACTLGELFAGLKSRDQISRLLTAYEEIRQPRWASVQETDSRLAALFMLPPGPEKDRRDAEFEKNKFSVSMDDQEEGGELQDVWQSTLEMYAFDASDAVQDWRTQWAWAMPTATV